MMELYRETGVNPLGGCLPIFIQNARVPGAVSRVERDA